MTSQLDELVSLISSAADYIKKEYQHHGTPVLSLDETQEHPYDTAHVSREFQHALRTLQGACAQLSTLVTPPSRTLNAMALCHYVSSCLDVVSTNKVADHLFNHPEGLPVSELAQLTKIDEAKLLSILRLLVTKHCFKEVRPNVFANNRLSIGLVSDHPTSAVVSLFTGECLQAGAALTSTVSNLTITSSTSPKDSAFSHAMNFDGSLWDWFGQVSPKRYENFNRATIGYAISLSTDAMVQGFPWKDQPEGTSVCDIGGGIGYITMQLAKANPQLRIIVQDLPPVIEEAKKFWENSAAEVVKTGRVQFAALNFLKESPTANCDFYYIKNILHDWLDSDCEAILNHARKVMKPSSRLIVQEIVVHSTPSSPNGNNTGLTQRAPAPLLPNYGEGRILDYYCDLCMMASVNAKERTIEEFIALGERCDLEVVQVWDCGQTQAIEYKISQDGL